MDAILYFIVMLGVYFLAKPVTVKSSTSKVEFQPEEVRTTKLNENFYEDEDAFMRIAHALGFPKGMS